MSEHDVPMLAGLRYISLSSLGTREGYIGGLSGKYREASLFWAFLSTYNLGGKREASHAQ